jgi:hypothetical protein
VAIAVLLVAGGCAANRVPEATGVAVADPAPFASELLAATLPGGPQQFNFRWTLVEQATRLPTGTGSVRVEAPQRIRLDLFGPRGETVLAAALVDGEYRLPSAVSSPVPLPSPSLLWGAMGVLSPPVGGTLTTANTREEGAEVRYSMTNGEIFIYSFAKTPAMAHRLAKVERAGGRGVIESVTLSYAPTGTLAIADYRNWAEFRDLSLEVESQRSVDPFPAAIWRP